MAIKKQYLKSKPTVKVTLSLPKAAAPGAQEVKVLGDFNAWTEGIDMKKSKSGEFKTTVTLPANSTFQFRYLIDGEKWENDWQADGYINNGVSAEDNSVISV